MRVIRVRYYRENDNWWADSEDLPGWTAAGATFEEVRQMAHEGAAEFAETAVAIEEVGVPMQQVEFDPENTHAQNIQTFTNAVLNQINAVEVRWLPDSQGALLPALGKHA